MAVEVPSAPKVYTTTYENFRGVDFTNDPTNIWYRRSPSAKNMLPDDAGRPFKRTGWEKVIGISDLQTAYTDSVGTACETSLEIDKCFYFELAGIDHIIIFAEGGVFKYADEELTLLETDMDCYAAFDRAFFFEGGGKSAFYIYSNYKVWVYDETLTMNLASYSLDMGDGIYIPRVLYSTDPSSCTGTTLEEYNLIGNRVAIEYIGNEMCYAKPTSDVEYAVGFDAATFKTKVASVQGTYVFTYNSSAWELNGSTVTLSEYGLSIGGTASDDDEITVEYHYGCLLLKNIAQSQYDEVSVFVSDITQFDTELTVATAGTSPSATTCVLHTDSSTYPESERRAWIEFDSSISALVTGEDAIRIVIPVSEVTTTTYTNEASSGTGQLVY